MSDAAVRSSQPASDARRPFPPLSTLDDALARAYQNTIVFAPMRNDGVASDFICVFARTTIPALSGIVCGDRLSTARIDPELREAIFQNCLGAVVSRLPIDFFASADGSGNKLRLLVVCQNDDVVLRFGEASGVRRRSSDRADADSSVPALQQRIVALEETNRRIERFALVAAHDLQAPLRRIQSYCRLMQLGDGNAHPVAARYAMMAEVAAERMSRLVTDLLTFARVSSSAARRERVRLGDLIHQVVQDLDIRASGATVTLSLDGLPDVPACRPQMRQLFQNLLQNALKFRCPDRALSVTVSAARLSHDFVQVSITDTGIGVARESLRDIFDPFRRLNAASEYEGSGMGLAICKEIVEMHGGHIAAASDGVSGTTFSVVLPTSEDGVIADGAASSGAVA